MKESDTQQPVDKIKIMEDYLLKKKQGFFNTGRSTMPASNASLVQVYFDEMLRTGRSVKLSCELFNVGLGTLYRKILDGATWLAERSQVGAGELVKTPAEQLRYQAMKAQWKLEEVEDGFIIHPNKFALSKKLQEDNLRKHKQAAATAQVNAYARSVLSWKKDFIAFVETSTAGEEFVREGLALSSEDREFIVDACNQAGMEFDINEDGTRMVVIKS